MKYLKIIAIVAVAALVFACAPQVPQKDIDAANAAYTDAQSAKADAYAPDSFKAAQDAQAALQAELDAQNAKTSGKSYAKTTELAKALLTAAGKAKTDATANVETFKTDVATLLTDVQTAFPTVQAEAQVAAKNAKKAAKAKIDVKALTAQMTQGEQALKDAQAANDASDFATAKAKLTALKDQLTQAQTALEAAGFKPAAAPAAKK
jgi:hypothetical protein